MATGHRDEAGYTPGALPETANCTEPECKHASVDVSGKCYSHRMADPGYRAQLDTRIIAGMQAEYEAHPEWRDSEGRWPAQPKTVAFNRTLGDAVVHADCPGCGWAVPVGFARDDSGAETRQPRPCGPCQEAELAEREAGTNPEVVEINRDELELGA